MTQERVIGSFRNSMLHLGKQSEGNSVNRETFLRWNNRGTPALQLSPNFTQAHPIHPGIGRGVQLPFKDEQIIRHPIYIAVWRNLSKNIGFNRLSGF
jgi:hypothetical protein